MARKARRERDPSERDRFCIFHSRWPGTVRLRHSQGDYHFAAGYRKPPSVGGICSCTLPQTALFQARNPFTGYRPKQAHPDRISPFGLLSAFGFPPTPCHRLRQPQRGPEPNLRPPSCPEPGAPGRMKPETPGVVIPAPSSCGRTARRARARRRLNTEAQRAAESRREVFSSAPFAALRFDPAFFICIVQSGYTTATGCGSTAARSPHWCPCSSLRSDRPRRRCRCPASSSSPAAARFVLA